MDKTEVKEYIDRNMPLVKDAVNKAFEVGSRELKRMGGHPPMALVVRRDPIEVPLKIPKGLKPGDKVEYEIPNNLTIQPVRLSGMFDMPNGKQMVSDILRAKAEEDMSMLGCVFIFEAFAYKGDEGNTDMPECIANGEKSLSQLAEEGDPHVKEVIMVSGSWRGPIEMQVMSYFTRDEEGNVKDITEPEWTIHDLDEDKEGTKLAGRFVRLFEGLPLS